MSDRYVVTIKGFYFVVRSPLPLHILREGSVSVNLGDGIDRVFHQGTWQPVYGPVSEDEAVQFLEDITGERPVKL